MEQLKAEYYNKYVSAMQIQDKQASIVLAIAESELESVGNIPIEILFELSDLDLID